MQTVLSHLQESSEATAQTLGSVQSTMQTMNERIGSQLGRIAQIIIDFSFSRPGKKVDLFNRGNVDLTVWGYKVDGEPTRIYERPVSLKRSEHHTFSTLFNDINKVKENDSGNLNIYLRDDFGNDFIGEIAVPPTNVGDACQQH